jgi:hypothetical protein
MSTTSTVWVFVGENASFPCAVFSILKTALNEINNYRLSGILTEFPLNTTTYQWAILAGYFNPKKEYQLSSKFVQQFTSASMRHYHFTDGVCNEIDL